MAKTIAFLFIGQAPRPDVMDDVRAFLGPDVLAAEYGALDGLRADEIAALSPKSAEDTLITKLQDGSQVRISHKAVERLLEGQIAGAVQNGASLCAVMCTGSFELKCDVPVITADLAFHGQPLPEGIKTVGVIVPLLDQQETFAACYMGKGLQVLTGAADPYGETERITSEAKRLADRGAQMIRLDCMGYTAAQAEAVRKRMGLPVCIPRIEIAKVIKKEL